MMKLYQVVNFQHQPVRVFNSQQEAEQHIHLLRETYSDEGFYIVELQVVFSIGNIR